MYREAKKLFPELGPQAMDVEEIKSIPVLTYEQLRVEFMRLSPTYALAAQLQQKVIKKNAAHNKLFAMFEEGHRLSRGRGIHAKSYKPLTKSQMDEVMARFEVAQATYREYGNINRPYNEWYDDVGCDVYDDIFRRTVERVATYKHPKYDDQEFLLDVKEYLENMFQQASFPKSLLLNVPTNVPKKRALKEIKRYLDLHTDTDAQDALKKPLAGKRHQKKGLMLRLKVLMHKTLHPNAPLWQSGMLFRVNPNCIDLHNRSEATQEEKAKYRMYIGISCNKALMYAQYIAENAALDIFPSVQPLLLPSFNYETLGSQLRSAWPTLIEATD